MANEQQLDILRQGVDAWNRWRRDHKKMIPDLSRAFLGGAKLREANFEMANLRQANLLWSDLDRAQLDNADLSHAFLSHAWFRNANLRRAKLTGASIIEANFLGAHLEAADLSGANLAGSNFWGANLRGAVLRGADLRTARLVECNLETADLTGSHVYGASVWDVSLDGAIQQDLVITQLGGPNITVDNLEVAQFIYLLLNNAKLREVIDTVTSKAVLILGRFKPERKIVLNKIREYLRKRNYLPILFDFHRPDGKDLTGTVTTLANLSRFIIADLTDPSSVPHELATIVPHTFLPIQTILLEDRPEYATFRDLMLRYDWVLEPYKYKSARLLLAQLDQAVIAPAEAKATQMRERIRSTFRS